MHMSREEYISGYLDGVIGNISSWDKSDIELILGRVLKESAHEKWWNTPIPRWGRITPNEMWETSAGKLAVHDLVLDYLDPSFS
jgi:hypothetical protein